MKFDVIFGNPPFQDNIKKSKTQHKLWTEFTLKAVNEWLKDEGSIGWITPQSWGSPSNKVLDIFRDNQLEYLNMDTKEHFPDIGSTFSHYLLTKKKNESDTIVINNKQAFSLFLDKEVLWISNDFCDKSFSIHKKVMFSTKDKFIVKYDYVTCHNVIRHAQTLKDKKLEEMLRKLLACKEQDKQEDWIKKIKEHANKEVDITVSEEQTDKHIYPVFHTNNKIWYSSKKQDFSEKKKVLWSRSGYVKARYDPGTMGCTDMGYYILVDSDEEGNNLQSFLNSSLMQYIFKSAKWSGFGNEKVFSSIPKISLEKKLTEEEIFKLFDITEEEQEFIKIRNETKKNKSITKSEIVSDKRVKQYGEVFTPIELVSSILDLVNQEIWEDENKTFIDPACGNGNFLVEIINKRLDSGVDTIKALSTLFGADIMQDNIDKAKKRIIDVLLSKRPKTNFEEVKKIIDKNLICCDSLQEDLCSILEERRRKDV